MIVNERIKRIETADYKAGYRDRMAGFYDNLGQDAFGGPALVGGENKVHTGDILYGGGEFFPRFAAGVTFVAVHQGGPLLGRHGPGAAVGE